MWTRYTSPEELSPQQAAQVLAFLNQAKSALEIAERVEFPNELDIGLRVGQRLLDRRAALGGAFATIAQVAAVPYLGPERFTELVAAITGYAPPQVTLQSLLDEIAELRAQLAQQAGSAASGALTIELHALVPRSYLGQRVSLVVQVVRGTDRKAAVDVPVTLVTTWGELHAVDGFSVQQAPSITLRTGLDGSCRVTLVPRTIDALRTEQQVALDTLLETLSPDAATPSAASKELLEIVSRYRKPESSALRQAVDVYFRTFAARLLDEAPTTDPLLAWPLENAAVFAHAQLGTGAAPAASVGASAVWTAHFRNWLPAWLASFRTQAEGDTELRGSLTELVTKGASAEAMVPAAYGRIERFVQDQPGLVGKFVGQQVASQTFREVVDTGIAELPLDTRIALRGGLHVAAHTLAGRGGVDLLTSMDDTQTAQRSAKLTDSALADVRAGLAEMGGRIADLTGSVARIDVDVGGLRDALPNLQTNLTNANLAIDGLRSQLTTNLSRVDTELGRIDSQLAVKLDTSTFNGFRSSVETNVGQLVTDVGVLRGARPG